MNLARDSSILVTEPVREYAPIDPAVTRGVQFEVWLDNLPLGNCPRHHRTRLEIRRSESRKVSLSEPVEEIWYHWWYLRDVPMPLTRKDYYPFVALSRCPVCKLQYARVPPEFYESSFAEFQTDTQERASNLAKCRKFAAQLNEKCCGFELMSGFPGNGKTRLACNIVREVDIDDVLYVRQGELTVALRATYSRKDVILHSSWRRDEEATDDEPPTPLSIVQRVDLLVLDEIGSNSLANDERLLLDELIKHRYEHRKSTILISNLPLTGTPDTPGLKEFLGDALGDRIKEATGNGKFIVQFSGESYRRTTGEHYLEGLG